MSGPYLEFSRAEWSKLSLATPLPLTENDIVRLRGLGDPISLAEVDAIYRPISRLLNLYIKAAGALNDATSAFLGELVPKAPYLVGITGSVAVGKTTVARVLREMIARWPETPQVALVTTDAFLFPNEELARRGLMDRKGFPKTYDRAALLDFVQRVKADEPEVTAPVYSHVIYDIIPGATTTVRQPDVLILEGLNILQPDENGIAGTVGLDDYLDFSIYVDANTADIRNWYIDRFLALRATAFQKPDSYFRRFAELPDAEAIELAAGLWENINEPNLDENILPTRSRANLVLVKGGNHNVTEVLLKRR